MYYFTLSRGQASRSERLSWVVLAYYEVAATLSAGLWLPEGLTGAAGHTSKMTPRGHWQETWIYYCMQVYGVSHSTVDSLPQGEWQEDREREQGTETESWGQTNPQYLLQPERGGNTIFFCHIILLTQTNVGKKWEGTTWLGGQLPLRQDWDRAGLTEYHWHVTSLWTVHVLLEPPKAFPCLRYCELFFSPLLHGYSKVLDWYDC